MTWIFGFLSPHFHLGSIFEVTVTTIFRFVEILKWFFNDLMQIATKYASKAKQPIWLSALFKQLIFRAPLHLSEQKKKCCRNIYGENLAMNILTYHVTFINHKLMLKWANRVYVSEPMSLNNDACEINCLRPDLLDFSAKFSIWQIVWKSNDSYWKSRWIRPDGGHRLILRS